MKFAVTGAAGLIGAHVVRAAAAGGHSATAVVRASGRLDALEGVTAAMVTADVLGPLEARISPVFALVTTVRTSTTAIGVALNKSSFPFLLLDKKPIFLALLNVNAKSSFSVLTGFPRLLASEPFAKSI